MGKGKLVVTSFPFPIPLPFQKLRVVVIYEFCFDFKFSSTDNVYCNGKSLLLSPTYKSQFAMML